MAFIKFHNLPEFQRTLREYVKYSRRDRVTIVNTKAYYIACGALYATYKASKADIRKSFSRATGAIIGKIINKRRAERGEKGLYGEQMLEAQVKMRAMRLRAVAFLKSGWIPAIKKLYSLAERPGRAKRPDADSKRIKKPKGSASPATGLLFTKAIIANASQARHSTTPDPLDVYGVPGLEEAIAAETVSMQDYIERKMRASAKRLAIKTD